MPWWCLTTASTDCLQVLFQYLPGGRGSAVIDFAGIQVLPTKHVPALAHAKMDLSFTMTGPHVALDYMAELYNESTVRRLFDSFVAVLQQMVEAPHSVALASSLLSAEDTRLVACFSCGKERPQYLTAPLFHEAFSTVATQRSGRSCLYFEGDEMSYGQVEVASNAVAAALTGLGVRRGMVVGVMLERSLDLLVAMLGVFKAGGALTFGCTSFCRPTSPSLLYFLRQQRLLCQQLPSVLSSACSCTCPILPCAMHRRLPALRPQLP